MIFGAHVIIDSKDAKADRAFFQAVLGLSAVDAGHGWLIFALPPAEVAVHPAEENLRRDLAFMCDDLGAEIAALGRKGVRCSDVQEASWGSLTRIRLPGGGDVEDATVALLTFANGALATVEEGWVLPDGHPNGFDQRLEVNGTIGRAELVGHYTGLAVMSDARETWPDTAIWPTVRGRITGVLAQEVDHFVACLRTGEAPLVTGEDGLMAVRIALAVEEAARTGQAVLLEQTLPERP